VDIIVAKTIAKTDFSASHHWIGSFYSGFLTTLLHMLLEV